VRGSGGGDARWWRGRRRRGGRRGIDAGFGWLGLGGCCGRGKGKGGRGDGGGGRGRMIASVYIVGLESMGMVNCKGYN
jgi:hypothetical protein